MEQKFIHLLKQMHMRKFFLLIIAVVLSTLQLWAQRTINGKVTDDKGSGIPNVSVTIKGTNIGTTTNPDGSFTVSVPSNAKTLIFSAIGLGEKEIDITSSNNYPVTLSTTVRDMREVVVVAYGTQKRADITGSVATVKSAEIENKPFTSIDKALQGK